jgi:hypothetical protein
MSKGATSHIAQLIYHDVYTAKKGESATILKTITHAQTQLKS